MKVFFSIMRFEWKHSIISASKVSALVWVGIDLKSKTGDKTKLHLYY